MIPGKFEVEKTDHDLQLDDDISSHQKGWRIQRVGFAIMVLIIIAASLGLMGTGPLSNRTVTVEADTVNYEYFGRHESRMQLELKLNNEVDSTLVSIPQAYLNHFRVESFEPKPAYNYILNDNVFYIFRTQQKASITINLQPLNAGWCSGQLLVNNQPFQLSHFIYP